VGRLFSVMAPGGMGLLSLTGVGASGGGVVSFLGCHGQTRVLRPCSVGRFSFSPLVLPGAGPGVTTSASAARRLKGQFIGRCLRSRCSSLFRYRDVSQNVL